MLDTLSNAFDRTRHSTQKLVEALSSIELPIQFEKTLIIIDMQTEFMNHYGDEESIVPAICSLIECARRHEWPIIVLEYEMNGITIEKIRNSLEGYHRQKTVYKIRNDGGQEVLECMDNHPAWPLNLLVCGIYGNACVPSTVAGLFGNSDAVEIDVVTDAVYEEYRPLIGKPRQNEPKEVQITVEDVLSLATKGCGS